MAGDWTQMRHTLLDDPRVIAIARQIRQHEDFVIGKLFRVWTYADRHTKDGVIPFSNDDHFDEKIALHTGMAAAMRSVGWLADSGNGLSLPHFAEHNGTTAKARACTRKRVHNFRSKSITPKTIDCNASPLPEKRREENIKTPLNIPPGLEAYSDDEKVSFARVWEPYPKKERMLWALQQFTNINPDEHTLTAMLSSIEKRRRSPQWQKDNGRWIPFLENWLANRRWLDDSPTSDSKKAQILAQRAANAQEKASAVPLGELTAKLTENMRRA